MKKSYLRTRYIIYPEIQLSLIAANTVAWFVFVLTLFLVNRAASSEMRSLGEAAGFATDHIYFKFLAMQSQSLLIYLVAGAAIALVLTSIFFVWYSHRLVGPLFNLQRYLRQVRAAREGSASMPGPLQFRKNDFFQDLTDDMNFLVQTNAETRRV